MLVLHRRVGERIRIGDSITITIMDFHGATVGLGIEAPEDVRIMRDEIPAAEMRPRKTRNTRTEQSADSDEELLLAAHRHLCEARSLMQRVLERDQSLVRVALLGVWTTIGRIADAIRHYLESREGSRKAGA